VDSPLDPLFPDAVYDLSLRALNRVVYFRVLKAVAIQSPDPMALERRHRTGMRQISVRHCTIAPSRRFEMVGRGGFDPHLPR